jgi:hypothetical protein
LQTAWLPLWLHSVFWPQGSLPQGFSLSKKNAFVKEAPFTLAGFDVTTGKLQYPQEETIL